MKIKLIVIGKTEKKYIQLGLEEYIERLGHYCTFEFIEHSLQKRNFSSAMLQKEEEGKQILGMLKSSDMLVLLDEMGKEYNSVEFSSWIVQKQNSSVKSLVFVIGGAFGFSEEVYKRANHKVSLSKLTFSHQMVRLFFLEQLYRAFTIIRGEKYHHA